MRNKKCLFTLIFGYFIYQPASAHHTSCDLISAKVFRNVKTPGILVPSLKNEKIGRFLSDGTEIANFSWHSIKGTNSKSRAQVVSFRTDHRYLKDTYLSELIFEFYKRTGILELKFTVSEEDYGSVSRPEDLSFVRNANQAGYKKISPPDKRPIYSDGVLDGFVFDIVLSR